MKTNEPDKSKKTVDEAAKENLANFLENGSGIRYSYNVYVVKKDTVTGRVLLGGLGAMGAGQMWSKLEASHEKCVGWDEAVDEISVKILKKDLRNQQVFLVEPDGVSSSSKWVPLIEAHQTYPGWDSADCVNIHEEWASKNRREIEFLLSQHLSKSDMTVMIQKIDKFLDLAYRGQGGALPVFPSLPVGVISNLLVNMGYWLGNMQKVGFQIAEEFEESGGAAD